MDPQKISELAKLLRNNGDKILTSEFKLTLSGALLRGLNDSFKLIADSVDKGNTQERFQVVKPINSKSPVFRDLQLIHDFVQKTTLLCIVHYAGEEYFQGSIDINKFRALDRLEVHKTNVKQILGIQPLRSRLQHLVCVKSIQSVEDIITRCGGDNSNGFIWNELRIADFSYNNLQTVDTSLEFAQHLQHLNLRHNKLKSVSAIKWLPLLKSLDVSFNCLQSIPQFHIEACKRLQSLNMSNNFLEDIIDVSKLDALINLDLSDNCLMEHSSLLPLSALMTLSYLNLYGNPLHCHPKHRLATAQYLHKNTATVKFVLDFELLSKNEKSLTGKHQGKYHGSLNRFATRSSASINSDRRTPSSLTPASSIGSQISFKFQESSTDTDFEVNSIKCNKKRSNKIRTVDILDPSKPPASEEERQKAEKESRISKPEEMTRSMLEESKREPLEAKKHIDTLRKKYGAEWLQTGKAEMVNSVMGIDSINKTENIELEHEKSRQLFHDYLKEENNTTVFTSTPNDDSYLNETTPAITPIKASFDCNNTTIYMSFDNNNSIKTIATEPTLYKSADSGLSDSQSACYNNDHNKNSKQILKDDNDNLDNSDRYNLQNVYPSSNDNDDPVASDLDDDEETYIVFNAHNINEPIFLTISSNYLREKNSLTQRTLTKWNLQMLESCDRIKSNTLRINFDTVKMDKRERIYTIEDDLCQEVEKKLRNILAQRDLHEMNIMIYRCVNCTLQFSREISNSQYPRSVQDISCPSCKSQYVAEITDLFKNFDKMKENSRKISPALVVNEEAVIVPSPKTTGSEIYIPIPYEEDAGSIGSAKSINGSSSCSRISPSNSSFDSNQSVVGSSNTDRENEFQNMNTESDVDIISNPSQSSIEVLEHSSQYSSRKTSEERRISHAPHLETIDDHDLNYTQRFIEREFGGVIKGKPINQSLRSQSLSPSTSVHPQQNHNQNQKLIKQDVNSSEISPAKSTNTKMFMNLTESSSSGSVTDSICTSYEQQQQSQQNKSQNVNDTDQTLTSSDGLSKNKISEKRVLNNILDAEKLPLAKTTGSEILVLLPYEEDTGSIGSGKSINGSSSCSRISRAHSSFDSNQSVAGSSNTDRQNDFQMNTESDVDIISNGERNLDDQIKENPVNQSLKSPSLSSPTSLQSQQNQNQNQNLSKQDENSSEVSPPKSTNTKIFMNLTESSSSGSVTDSICTSYEQQQQSQQNKSQNVNDTDQTLTSSDGLSKNKVSDKLIINNLLDAERNGSSIPTKDEIENLRNANNNNNNNTNNNKEAQKGQMDTLKREDSAISSMFGAIFQSTNILMSSSKKLLNAESTIKTGSALSSSNNNTILSQPYKFNYSDFRDVDHRLKLYFYQTKFEEGNEHFQWIIKGRIYNEITDTIFDGIVVMSTCKCYVMEAFAKENDDVTKWLKQTVSVTVDRLESIQLLPWKVGLIFQLRGWGKFSLLLQDILRTDSLLLHFANDYLPTQCDLNYQPSTDISKRLTNAVLNEPLKMLSLLNNCEVSFENAKRSFGLCSLLATDTHIYLTSEKFAWLSLTTNSEIEHELEICMTQFMSNLVDVERPADNIFLINFLDESHGKCELWKCSFETKENAESCLNAIAQSWQQLFGVPLLNA